MELKVDVDINSPKAQVWAAISDIGNCQKMISAIIDLKILNQPEEGLVGLKWQETRKMFGKEAVETMWITDSVEQEYYATRAENCGAIYVTRLSVEEQGDNTRLTMSFTGTSDSFFVRLMSAIMSLFMKKSMLKMLQKDLNEIKTFVEKSSAGN